MTVKRVKIDSQYENLVLADDVYKNKTILLVHKGEVLTPFLIERLQKHGITHIYVVEKP